MNILCVFGFSSPFYVLTSVIDCLTRAKLAVLNSLSFVQWANAEVHHYYLFIYLLVVNNFIKKKKVAVTAVFLSETVAVVLCFYCDVTVHHLLFSPLHLRGYLQFSFHLRESYQYASAVPIISEFINAINLPVSYRYKYFNSIQCNSIFCHTFLRKEVLVSCTFLFLSALHRIQCDFLQESDLI